ncbi:helix-turn-helix domain-containing protein [Streptococcus equi]|uniref:helix-turn-helix domain-containing protein n=1 Tax=Streptococcus equi TaxID=1336 RepID=UPI001CE6E589|nr:helix-turn-helix transcriptional regulator [Streptococcus equi]MDI6035570.1 helix-turn-helix transcriptional regulator [Streptococcus equi subsp. zooepidemicus]QZA21869.1 helix-turn-helix domain-containing protein [Streptococcus equi subsp. zooepidemicus]
MTSFSDRLKELRKKNKLTQQELADKVGTNRVNITKWETGRTSPNLNDLSTLAKVLSTTTDYLTSGQVVDVTDKTEEERKAVLFDKLETMYNTFQDMKKSGLELEKVHQLIDLTGNEPFYHSLADAIYSDEIDVSLADRIAINFKDQENDLTRLAGLNTNSTPKQSNTTKSE